MFDNAEEPALISRTGERHNTQRREAREDFDLDFDEALEDLPYSRGFSRTYRLLELLGKGHNCIVVQ